VKIWLKVLLSVVIFFTSTSIYVHNASYRGSLSFLDLRSNSSFSWRFYGDNVRNVREARTWMEERARVAKREEKEREVIEEGGEASLWGLLEEGWNSLATVATDVYGRVDPYGLE